MSSVPPPATSPLPRLRLGAAIAASAAVPLIPDPDRLTAALSIAIPLALIVALWGGHAGSLARRMLATNVFVALLWITLPWQFGADGLTVSESGTALALLLSLRANLIVLSCTTLLAGMDAFAIARAAGGLGLPPKMGRLLALMVRYLGVIFDTRRKLGRAMRARGFRPGANRRTLAVTAQMVALLLLHAMLRAERVALAMRARGFAPAARPRASHSGLAPAAGILALLLAVLWLRGQT